MRFAFWGSGAPNYGKELLEVACRFMFEYPKELQDAILNNYLVNPSGLNGHWQECDFFQEHCNKAIKTVFNTKNSDWDSRFLREDVAPNISGLARLRESVLRLLGLERTGHGITNPDYGADINVLASHYLREHAFEFQPGRTQTCTASDMFSDGYDRVESSVLKSFLERTANGRIPQVDEEDTTLDQMEDFIEMPLEPLVMEDGVLQIDNANEDSENEE
jgi:hypothetical protein